MNTDTQPPTNIVPITPPKRWSRVEIAHWFLRMGTHLLQGDLKTHDEAEDSVEPEGFLLVLLNADDLVIYQGCSGDLYDDAVCAVNDHAHYRTAQHYGCTWVDTPDEARRQRRERAIDDLSHRCQYDPAHRFATVKARNLHERSCRPGSLPVVPEHWEPLRVVLPEES